MTDSVHSKHQRGDHSLCDYLFCDERQVEETSNRECLYAKAVLKAIEKRGGNAEKLLGEEHSRYVELSHERQPHYLPNRPGSHDLIKANMDVREAMEGIPKLWSIAEYREEDDDFDIDEFLSNLA